MKRDLFVTDFWEFDFPYHHQIKNQIFENLQDSNQYREYLQGIKSLEEKNAGPAPSATSYGGEEYHYDKDLNLSTFFETQVKKLLQNVSSEHSWEKGQWTTFDQWLNINTKGDFNPPHIHPGRHYSGCYYAQFPEKSGRIHFLDPRPQHRIYTPDPLTAEDSNPFNVANKYDSSLFTYQVQEGKVVIFPSWLMHYVDPNKSDNLRISIAFNAKYDQGYDS
tara:strand:+ start:142 stop:801 length:660 start_codon:yes stop_codon:yes gene_type:complete